MSTFNQACACVATARNRNERHGTVEVSVEASRESEVAEPGRNNLSSDVYVILDGACNHSCRIDGNLGLGNRLEHAGSRRAVLKLLGQADGLVDAEWGSAALLRVE